ncbi:glycoside hydrolase family 3 N-terminal domain-containing protein, partial [Caulobacter segnis]
SPSAPTPATTSSSSPAPASVAAGGGFSQWRGREAGLAAGGDPALVRRFGDIARQEYRAVGIHQALSPMADLATEPRWSRINGTFGEDPDLVGRLVKAYVQGFQGGATGLAPNGVSAVVKHWAGYGRLGQGLRRSQQLRPLCCLFPAGRFDLHVKPFDGERSRWVSQASCRPYAILKDLALDGQSLRPKSGPASPSSC